MSRKVKFFEEKPSRQQTAVSRLGAEMSGCAESGSQLSGIVNTDAS